MTSLEAYKRFELKLNSLANSDNVDISPGEFVLIYNEQQVKWYTNKFSDKSSRFSINDVQILAERDKILTSISSTDEYEEYSLPIDYLDYISAYCKASRGTCTDRRMRTYEVMLTNRELAFRDPFNNPSFDYSETFTTLSKDRIQVYKTDFSVDSVFLTYYRFPRAIDIAGYTKIDQTPSSTIDPELTDDFINEIIDWCVADVQRTFDNPQGYQLAADRIK